MLLSMTGYGRGETNYGSARLSVEVRTVNHRFCEISIRLPRALSQFEGKVRERVQGKISRGKITLNISIDGNETPTTRLSLNRPVAKAYFDVLEELRGEFDLKGDIGVDTFLALPDLLTWEQDVVSEEESWADLEIALTLAIADVCEMKDREGRNLAVDLKERLRIIDTTVEKVVEQVPVMVARQKQKLQDRIAELVDDLDYKKNRLESEMTLFADRTDCTEECVRLRSHLEQFHELIDSPEPAGRKLNFLLQEMNRETNTIGSKAQDVPIARDVIQIKEEIEKLREQVQNFE